MARKSVRYTRGAAGGFAERFSGFGKLRFRRAIVQNTAPSPPGMAGLSRLQPQATIVSEDGASPIILSASGIGALNYANVAGAVTVRGFAGGSPGQLFLFLNIGSNYNVTLKHVDGTLTAAPDARLQLPGAADLVLAPLGCALFVMHEQLGYWLCAGAS